MFGFFVVRNLFFFLFFFFFNDTATTEIYTLSLHDALPIFVALVMVALLVRVPAPVQPSAVVLELDEDRKSTRLNSSHGSISYAVFCLKKKKKHTQDNRRISNTQHDGNQPR